MRRPFRIVRSTPPTLADILTHVALRRPLPRDPGTARLRRGISVYESEREARRRTEELLNLGGYLAELHVDEEPRVRMERTTRSRGHHTLWGAPNLLRRSLVRVVAIEAPTRRQRG